MVIHWEDRYSVKIAEIDEQHKKLLEMLAAIEAGTKEADYVKTVHSVLNELMEYVLVHFYTEEKYMESVNYIHFEAHKKIHEELAQSVNDRVNEIISRETTALDLIKLNNFLVQWIKQHILEEDHAYMDAMKEMHDI